MSTPEAFDRSVRHSLFPWVPPDVLEIAVRNVRRDLLDGGFDGLMFMAQAILDRHYPDDVPLVCDQDSSDPGPRLAAALRDCIEARGAA